MRKFICFTLSLLFVLSCLFACSDVPPEADDASIQAREDVPQESMEFTFLSGAGGWRTTLTLNADGTFSGMYHDSNMGEADEKYPNGTAYISEFSGKFESFEKVTDYSYKMTLANIETADQIGDEWIENGVRYIASDPYGLETGTEFILYLPETPIDVLPEYFLTWWPYRYDQSESPRDTLDCYGILNVETEYGFFNVA